MKYYTNISEGNIKEDIQILLTFRNKLKDHIIPEDKNIYRLHHISYHDDLYGSHHETHRVFETFKFPKGMTREEGFKVLSYLTDFFEKKANVIKCSFKSVYTIDHIITFEMFGFERVEVKNSNDIVDLFTIQGRVKRFKISKYYPKYFNWYKENVSKEEIINIYKRIGLEFNNFKQEKQLTKSR